jgi:monothiol glutaredoxin
MNTKSEIENIINKNDVCLFMKGVPEAPQCGFSMAVSNIVKYESIDVLANEEIRDGIKTFSDWPTIPQLYVKGEFIGGCDIVKEMFEKGQLKELLENKKII